MNLNPSILNMLERRSIRAYKDTPVPDELLNQILMAGEWAPSGMNRQSRQLTAVINPEILRRLSDAMQIALGREVNGGAFYGAPVAVLVSDERDGRNSNSDCAVVLQNMFLAANSLELGSCWINQLRDVGDVPEVRAILDEIGVPFNHMVYGTAAIGYAKAFTPPKDRVEGRVKVIR